MPPQAPKAIAQPPPPPPLYSSPVYNSRLNQGRYVRVTLKLFVVLLIDFNYGAMVHSNRIH